jgi:hypothetical protein
VAEGGRLDFAALGYGEDKIEELIELPEPILEKAMEFQTPATAVDGPDTAVD